MTAFSRRHRRECGFVDVSSCLRARTYCVRPAGRWVHAGERRRSRRQAAAGERRRARQQRPAGVPQHRLGRRQSRRVAHRRLRSPARRLGDVSRRPQRDDDHDGGGGDRRERLRRRSLPVHRRTHPRVRVARPASRLRRRGGLSAGGRRRHRADRRPPSAAAPPDQQPGRRRRDERPRRIGVVDKGEDREHATTARRRPFSSPDSVVGHDGRRHVVRHRRI